MVFVQRAKPPHVATLLDLLAAACSAADDPATALAAGEGAAGGGPGAAPGAGGGGNGAQPTHDQQQEVATAMEVEDEGQGELGEEEEEAGRAAQKRKAAVARRVSSTFHLLDTCFLQLVKVNPQRSMALLTGSTAAREWMVGDLGGLPGSLQKSG